MRQSIISSLGGVGEDLSGEPGLSWPLSVINKTLPSPWRSWRPCGEPGLVCPFGGDEAIPFLSEWYQGKPNEEPGHLPPLSGNEVTGPHYTFTKGHVRSSNKAPICLQSRWCRWRLVGILNPHSHSAVIRIASLRLPTEAKSWAPTAPGSDETVSHFPC